MLTFGNALKLRRGGQWVGGGAPEPTVLFQDDFEGHSPGAGVPSGWADGSGDIALTWTISETDPLEGTKSLRTSSASTGNRWMTAGSVNASDVTVSALVRLISAEGSNAQAMLRVRFQDANDGVVLHVDAFTNPARVQLIQIDGGVSTTLVTRSFAGVALGATYRARLNVAGASVRGGITTDDWDLTLTASTTLLTPGAVQLRHIGANALIAWDDVVVTAH